MKKAQKEKYQELKDRFMPFFEKKEFYFYCYFFYKSILVCFLMFLIWIVMKTVCLNMIVKNEIHVIRRCLAAVKGFIDYWVIVDTGSTDGTQAAIREFMQGCPGELYERPWRNFEHNRNEALDLARTKGNYVFFVDADEIMHISPSFDKSSLVKDYYFTKTVGTGQEFYFPKLIKNDPLWRWVGVLHESIQHPGDVISGQIDTIWAESVQDGARSRDPQQNEKDIAILKQAIADNPNDSSAYIYLEQNYFGAQDFLQALKYYEIRGAMEGAQDETFWSLFCIGQIQEHLGYAPSLYLESYLKAYQFDPSRVEPLERMANCEASLHRPAMAYILMKYAKTLPMPRPLSSGYYPWVHYFALDLLCADNAIDLGKIEEAQKIYRTMAGKSNLPAALIKHIESQLVLIEQWLRSDRNERKKINFSKMPINLSFSFRKAN